MTHLDVEQIQRELHHEHTPAAAESVRAHLAECVDCRSRVARAAQDEAELNSLLRHLDHAPPGVTAAAIIAKARRPSLARFRWAAGILLALTLGGVAYAQPAIRSAIVAVADWLGVRRNGPAPAVLPAPTPEPPLSGIALPPGRALSIRFTSPQAAGQIVVSLVDEAEVVVRAPVGAATYDAGVERLVVDNRDATASFEIMIPRDAPSVEIVIGVIALFRKEGSRINSPVSPDSTGVYLLPLTAPGR